MFITIQGIHINELHIKNFSCKDKTLRIIDSSNQEEIIYFTSEMEAKKEELRILKELNNG